MSLGRQLVTDAPHDLLAILRELATRPERAAVCGSCGCLCLPSEVCPNCHPERGTVLP